MKKSQFIKSSILTDSLAVRCADFTPSGKWWKYKKVPVSSVTHIMLQLLYNTAGYTHLVPALPSNQHTFLVV